MGGRGKWFEIVSSSDSQNVRQPQQMDIFIVDYTLQRILFYAFNIVLLWMDVGYDVRCLELSLGTLTNLYRSLSV